MRCAQGRRQNQRLQAIWIGTLACSSLFVYQMGVPAMQRYTRSTQAVSRVRCQAGCITQGKRARPVIAAKAALGGGAKRVLIIDLDAHRGGGTSSMIAGGAI